MNVPQKDFDHFGTLPVPETTAELASLLGQFARDNEGYAVHGWRGQANIDWKIRSSAVRRVTYLARHLESPELPSKILEDEVTIYQKSLIDEARLKGYGYHDYRELKDIELLACLQHFGAATRLVDFTRNAYIAVWFACESHDDQDGLLLGFSTPDPNCIVTASKLSKIYEGQWADNPDEGLMVWEPLHMFERMRVQQSLFVFGYSHNGPWGSLSPHPFHLHRSLSRQSDIPRISDKFFACAISPKLKSIFRAYWDSVFGYSSASLYPDIEGYSRSHSQTHAFGSKFITP